MDVTQQRPMTGRDLAAERVRAGLTQQQLAARLGLSRQRVSNAEGAYRPAPSLVARILAALERQA